MTVDDHYDIIWSMLTIDEDALALPFDTDNTPALFAALADASHHHRDTFTALSTMFYNVFMLLDSSDDIVLVQIRSAFAGSPRRDNFLRSYFKRPHTLLIQMPPESP